MNIHDWTSLTTVLENIVVVLRPWPQSAHLHGDVAFLAKAQHVASANFVGQTSPGIWVQRPGCIAPAWWCSCRLLEGQLTITVAFAAWMMLRFRTTPLGSRRGFQHWCRSKSGGLWTTNRGCPPRWLQCAIPASSAFDINPRAIDQINSSITVSRTVKLAL